MWSSNDFSLYRYIIKLLTVKHMGGGSSFIKTTAAGGTGKTPPGTGCKPGAVGGHRRPHSYFSNLKKQNNDVLLLAR